VAHRDLAELGDEDLLAIIQSLPVGSSRRAWVCEVLVARYRGLVHACANRYRKSPEPTEDLVQVGYVGLMKAINKFDPGIGHSLGAYAQPCITGEIKRYFRDKRWHAHIERPVQELLLEIRSASHQLAQQAGHPPGDADLAAYLGVTEDAIRDAWQANRLMQPYSLDAPLAGIDQSDLAKQVNPVAGFLLPDHMDESLEVFATDGRPLGELLHDAFSDAVAWEIAPGRTDVAPAAGPTEDPDISHHRVGWIAAGLVAADASARNGTPNRPETESALSAMLRAIDTTLWTVDPFGSLGSEHIAGLVGRPIAVVAARLSLDVYSDVTERAYADPALQAGRAAAYDALAALPFEVRLGEITRADDGLLGYFVDDDYTRFHLVDKVIAQEALPSGRQKGVLDPDSPNPTAPVAIDHPYVDDSGVLQIRPGQTVRLTLLMHPGGKVHLTSGILPRTNKALARDWVQPGLAVLAPSLRCGPLLIDADKVRLPKVASFPAEQLFTRRDTPTSWKDDPILAATQSALLPDTAAEVQEGWIRVAPNPPAPDAGTSG